MTTRFVVMERLYDRRLPSIEMRVSFALTARPCSEDHYTNPLHRQGDEWYLEMTPEGRKLMNAIGAIPGIEGLMCSYCTFMFGIAPGFDEGDITHRIFDAICLVLEDDVERRFKPDKGQVAFRVGETKYSEALARSNA